MTTIAMRARTWKDCFLSDLSRHIDSLLIYIFSHIYFRYSNLSLLYVTGLVRLDPSIEATSTSVSMPREKFDAWPSKDERKKRLATAKKYFKKIKCEDILLERSPQFYKNEYFYESEG